MKNFIFVALILFISIVSFNMRADDKPDTSLNKDSWDFGIKALGAAGLGINLPDVTDEKMSSLYKKSYDQYLKAQAEALEALLKCREEDLKHRSKKCIDMENKRFFDIPSAGFHRWISKDDPFLQTLSKQCESKGDKFILIDNGWEIIVICEKKAATPPTGKPVKILIPSTPQGTKP